MMTTTRKLKARPQRFARISGNPKYTEPATLTMHVAGRETNYHLYHQPSDYGTAYRLEKQTAEGEVYNVCFEGSYATCECMGHLRHWHCKHVDCLNALRQRNRI
jgi:hypothetical protein